ncbi:uncharacterized protein At5g39865-like [Lotus japonicus]|uniref:uncharacterized protein At5g39865-like n=1 Tax=Lotus japonicus TaxID=34305 RepID=UPI0025886ECE|nr:uncharacterized protein At5g39865-like [Lotus japonicus]
MWPTKWLSSSWRERTTKPPPPPTRTRSYGSSSSCYSFKDVETLIQPEPSSPKSPSLFHRLRASSPFTRFISLRSISPTTTAAPPDSDGGAVVIYYTSLRVVRRTFNDCKAVRSIFRRFPVAIDERDVCVDGGQFREELQEILGRQSVPLPTVFIGGEYIGGVDEVTRLYESGELREMIERLPRTQREACEACAGLRFVVCDDCDGSHKVFTEKSGFRSCSSCNPNGLIRCRACFFSVSRHSK